jgi:hypothetical protein
LIKEEGWSGKNEGLQEGRALRGLFLRELKNCIGWGFWRVWISSQNSIYVVKILSILKIH